MRRSHSLVRDIVACRRLPGSNVRPGATRRVTGLVITGSPIGDNSRSPDVSQDGARRPAVVQAAKTGMLFVPDRQTGRPIHTVEKRAVPASGM